MSFATPQAKPEKQLIIHINKKLQKWIYMLPSRSHIACTDKNKSILTQQGKRPFPACTYLRINPKRKQDFFIRSSTKEYLINKAVFHNVQIDFVFIMEFMSCTAILS